MLLRAPDVIQESILDFENTLGYEIQICIFHLLSTVTNVINIWGICLFVANIEFFTIKIV